MDHVYYIAECDFTIGNAISNRVLNNALSISATSNFNVTIIGYSNTIQITKKNIEIKNVKRGYNNLVKLFHYIFRGFSIILLLQKEKIPPTIIICYGPYSRILLPLLLFCRNKGIKIIADVTEWYDYSHLPMGRFGLVALDVYFGLTKLIPQCNGVIAISSFLENYYSCRGLKTIRIPVTIDHYEKNAESNSLQNFNQHFLNLIYAGTPGKKDLILDVMSAVKELANDGFPVRLHLLGLTARELGGKFIKYKDVVICYGRVNQDQVASYLGRADFSVLLRPNKRYSHAGFPTKFVESFNAGLPVISNITSDLGLYLKDGLNGYIVQDCSSDSLKATLRRIFPISRKEFVKMKSKAKETAKLFFDYRIYSKELESFLTEC